MNSAHFFSFRIFGDIKIDIKVKIGLQAMLVQQSYFLLFKHTVLLPIMFLKDFPRIKEESAHRLSDPIFEDIKANVKEKISLQAMRIQYTSFVLCRYAVVLHQQSSLEIFFIMLRSIEPGFFICLANSHGH